MIECRWCNEVFCNDAEVTGARCPQCRMPLYERPERDSTPSPLSPLPLGERGKGVRGTAARSKCEVHRNNPAVSICKRCGAKMCAACRTRWHDRPLCVSCVEASVDDSHNPQQAREHRWLAGSSLVLGVVAWTCVVLGGVSAAAFVRRDASLATLGAILILGSVLPALFSVGQAAAALRIRGRHMRSAATGLFLSASQLGALIGLVLLNVWNEM